jgi:hypothetical protein
VGEAAIAGESVARVFCIDWSEDDEACGAREAGWSLHLSREDATTYIRNHSSPHSGHGLPYRVEVPEAVYEEVRRTPYGAFKSSPRECPYPAVEENLDADEL